MLNEALKCDGKYIEWSWDLVARTSFYVIMLYNLTSEHPICPDLYDACGYVLSCHEGELFMWDLARRQRQRNIMVYWTMGIKIIIFSAAYMDHFGVVLHCYFYCTTDDSKEFVILLTSKSTLTYLSWVFMVCNIYQHCKNNNYFVFLFN